MQALLKKLNKINVKIDLVDEKLNIQAPKGVVTEDLLNEIKLHKSELIKFIALYKNENNRTSVIPKASKQSSYELSSSQKRMWLLNQFEKESIIYNMPGVFELKGFLSVNFLEKAFLALIERHESLRTSFEENDLGEIRQVILDIEHVKFQLQYEEIRDHENDAENLKSIIQAETNFSFDLSSDALLRAKLIKTSHDTYAFVCVMHHIISDGWSTEVMINELFTLYDFYANELVIPLHPLQIQYKDYAVWQQNQLRQKGSDIHKNYWTEKFSGEVPVLDLPGYQSRPVVKTYNGNFITQEISTDVYREFQNLCKSQDSTLFMGLLSVIKVLLYKYTQQSDIIIGSPIAGREYVELQNQIGVYVNTLALRTQFDGNDNFKTVLTNVKKIVLEAYEHQVYPFDELVENLTVKRDISRNPLFDVVVTLQNNSNSGQTLQNNSLQIKELQLEENTISKFDLEFAFQENENKLSLAITYNTDIYNYDFVQAILSHFSVILDEVVKQPVTSVRSLNYLTSTEKRTVLYDFNDTHIHYPVDHTIIELFEEQAAKTPDNIAVVFENNTLTYQELNEKANQIGNYLRNNYNIQPDNFIGVKLHRSNDLIVSILGVLKSGAAYIPIDPAYPQDRIDYIESDSNIKVLIDQKELQLIYNEIGKYSKLNIEKINHPNDLAYAIYTSGTTGNPKGVLIEHKNLINLCHWHITEFDVTESSKATLFSGVGFDASVWEIFPYLITGSSLFPINDEGIRFNSNKLVDFYQNHNISHSYVPTAICNDLINMDVAVPNIKLLVGGEALIINKQTKLEIYNNYGPTENTVVSTSWKVNTNKTGIIPIGSPISNTQIYILDEQKQPLPIGVSGKIYVSGASIARGYLNLPELTAEKFVTNPFVANTLMYETGDLGRWLADGSIEFLGRNDFQVKIRGHRIELGDIESVLIHFSPSLSQVVVAVQEQKGEKVLVAYYVSQDNIDKSDLRHFLQKELPEYMIPNFYVALDKVPLTPNGKVDRKALPGISESDIIRRAYVSPVSDHEIKLAVIWQDVLKVDQVGITDNFFELGGHSLIMVQVINHIFKELGKSLSFRDFFSNPTIEGLCGKLQESGYVPIPKAAAAVSYRLTSSQNRLWLLSQFEGGSLAYNMSTAVAFKGTIDHFHFQNAFRILIERHEILRTSFQITPLGEVMQFVKAAAEVHFEIPQKDFTGINAQGDALNAYLQQQNNAPFDLENAPLIRGTLAQLTQEDYVFQLSIHHIIGDGWSMEILVTELVTIYNALLSGTTANLEALRIQFKDYAVWMASDAQQEKLQLSGQYWLGQFSGDLPVLDLGYKARPSVQRYHGESLTHTFSKGFLQDLKHFSQQHDLTLFMTLMSGVNLLLHRYTGQDDIILGTPIAGREHQDLENQIGLYLNTLAVRTRLNSQGSFLDLVRHEKQVLLEAYDHQGYPLDELIGNLDLKRDMSRSALFDVLVVLQNQAENLSTAEELINLKVSSYELANKTSKFDLSYSFSQSDSLKLSITYNTDLYEAVFVERMFSHLEHLLSQAIANPAVLLKEIDYLTPLEQQELLIGFNTPLTSYSKEPVTALFEAQAKSNPMAAALVFGDKKVSYESLLEEVNSISDYLINKGVSRGDKIILCFESHLDKAIAGMLGILKAGAVYVPVDPDYPIERIEFIIADTQSKYVLSNTTDAALFANTDVEVILLDKLSPVVYGTKSISISGSDHAYVIYTSGSTGHPKGVLVNHKNISDYVSGLSSATAIESNTSFGLMSTIATDLGNTVLFSSLVFGKMLHLFSKSSLRDVDYIQAYFTAHSIDCIKIVPSYWRGLELGAAVGSPLKMIIFGGEELSIDLVRKIQSERAGIRIINHYGPTETTIGKLLHEVEADRDYYKIPIGRPFSNTRCYVVDEHLSLCPQGVVGELLIGGEGVSEGYLNNAGLTAQKFIADTFTDSPQKLYRTGDRVVMHFNGEIEFKGRIDNQVKILGHRIELSEIENVLNSHDAISSGVATVVSDAEGNQSLAAYVVYKTDAVEKTALLEFLRSRLPGIMIPASIVSIAEIPLTSNGKINRKALPAIDAADSAGRTYIAPESAVEIKLAQIWQEVLKTERVGITDNFFELGGNSLKVVKILHRVNHEFNIDINIKNVFKYPTIQDLAFHIIIAQKQKDISSTDKKLKEISL
ncbi:non-ribosomal peptide synthetase [Flavobacterium aquidurense]|uniref:Nonribosomal peptide synthetase n=1 Tax=Flavobacterium aquidurense TaxID=362413 RepID=A0A0N8VN78_9FLAO|nr:non-ribosomal peptide synthetase [Flavobacterium aquidurense]KQB41364.1 Nonribosomal peptide synthetase [Flavobacterium aquidurense]